MTKAATLADTAISAIPALTFAGAVLLMVNQSYVKVFEFAGRARFVPALLLCAIGVLWVVAHRRLPRTPRWFDLCAIGFLIFALVSSRWALAPELSLGRALSLAVSYVAVFWVMWIEADRHGPWRLLRALVAAIAIVMILNLLSIPIVPEGAFWAYLRYQGIMNNPNALGALVALTLPLALWYAVRTGTRAGWILVGVMFATAQLTQSRTTALAGLVGVGYYLFHAVPHRRLPLAGLGVFYVLLTALIPQATFAYQEYTDRQMAKVGVEQRYRASIRQLHEAEEKAARDLIAAARARLQPPPPAPVAPAPAAPAAPVKPAPAPVAPPPPPPAVRKTPPKPELPFEVEVALNQYAEARKDFEISQRPVLPDIIDPLKNPRNMHLATFSGRTIAWEMGVRFLSSRPLKGFGFGNEELVLPAHGIEQGMWPFTGYYMHNSYLGLAMQVGVVAASVFYVPLLALALTEWWRPAPKDDAALRYALRGVLFTGLVVATFESWIYAMGNAHAFPFWTAVMLLAAVRMGAGAPPQAAKLTTGATQ